MKLCLKFAELGLFAEKTPLWVADNRLGWIALRGFLDFLVLLSSSKDL